jgi:hypothetical protein
MKIVLDVDKSGGGAFIYRPIGPDGRVLKSHSVIYPEGAHPCPSFEFAGFWSDRLRPELVKLWVASNYQNVRFLNPQGVDEIIQNLDQINTEANYWLLIDSVSNRIVKDRQGFLNLEVEDRLLSSNELRDIANYLDGVNKPEANNDGETDLELEFM